MCLSTVYLNERTESSVAGTDVAELSREGEVVTIRTLFGEETKFNGYAIGEINLTENFVILKKEG